VLFTGCSKETIINEEPDAQDDVNHWMAKEMRKQYLWYDEIPERLDFTWEPEPFFHYLLSKKDGKYRNGIHQYYSAINRKTATSKAYMGNGNSFGFEFQYYYVENTKRYGLMVLYVLPNSPASEVGLKRGDWIYTLNGKPIPAPDNSAELNKLLDTSAPQTVEIGIAEKFNMPISRTIPITSRPVTDNPVLVHKTISAGNGQRVGYLLYNHFTSGPKGSEDETFNNSLRSAFAQFATDNVSEFVLDLRFNGGGLVSCSQLLATMLAPESALNDVLCYLTYNDKTKEKKTMYLDPKRIREGTHGANLNLSRLFVITSERTASASEIVINGLSPYMELIQVGTKTEGKNVASITIADNRYEWELHPIVSYLSNKDNFSDYANGFPPTSGFGCDDSKQGDYYPLGEPEEYILKHILNYIAYRRFAENKSQSLRSAEEINLIPLYNSLDSKKTNGAAILPADFYQP
jgi:C-terminal processing protease CtpA/Prc